MATSEALVPRRRGGLSRRRAITFYLLISPWLLGFILFTAGPMLFSFWISFQDYAIVNPPIWIGLQNYATLLEDPLVGVSLYNTLYYTILAVPLAMTTAMVLAMLLNQRFRGIALYRTIFYLPTIVPVVASTILWMWIYQPEWGLLNTALKMLGIPGPGWLNSEAWSKPALVLMAVWGSGGTMIIYLAGLQGVPEQLYEAASIDGATTWQRFWNVTIPMMTPTIFFTLVLGIIGSFQVFTVAFIATNGGPLDSTLFYMLYLFRNAFFFAKMGYASAMAWVLLVILLGLTAIQFAIAPRWVYYEGERRDTR
ncbi:MAG: sugar ABC transporter permease [Chloroflexi bacterium]|nr:sugar ABC transporter permease [Chloroflexota bacterium]